MTKQANNTVLPEEGFLRLNQVLSVFPVSKSAWWAGVKTGRFPAGVHLSVRTTAWDVNSIRELIAQTKAKDKS
jgi:predicted DNA-binding transcriptional regulator AlpA